MFASPTTAIAYLAATVFVAGMAWRTARWLATPVPFALAVDTARKGVVAKTAAMAGELGLFASLFRGDRRLWLAAWAMHASLAVIIVGHVVGIATLTQQFCYLGASPATSAMLSGFLGIGAGLIFAVSVAWLAFRRTRSAELRLLSSPADYAVLGLLLAVAATGLILRWTSTPADLAAVRSYLGGLLTLRPGAPPAGAWFALHFTLVNVLLIACPFSKLVHLTGGLVSRALLHADAPTYPTPDAGVSERKAAP